jgi:hypothetical protein
MNMAAAIVVDVPKCPKMRSLGEAEGTDFQARIDQLRLPEALVMETPDISIYDLPVGLLDPFWIEMQQGC